VKIVVLINFGEWESVRLSVAKMEYWTYVRSFDKKLGGAEFNRISGYE